MLKPVVGHGFCINHFWYIRHFHSVHVIGSEYFRTPKYDDQQQKARICYLLIIDDGTYIFSSLFLKEFIGITTIALLFAFHL